MATSETSVSFEESDTRHDEMHSTIEHWIDDLVDHVDDAQESKEFQEWLCVLLGGVGKRGFGGDPGSSRSN